MLKQTLNKGMSTPIAIGIVLILVIVVGGFTWWQYSEMWEEEAELPEIELPEKEEVEKVKEEELEEEKVEKEKEGVMETECDRWRKECTSEGGNKCGPCGCQNCCSGLISREVTHPWRTKNNEVTCLENMTAYTCVKCGDGICGRGEDWCICPEDCEKPNPEDLELGW